MTIFAKAELGRDFTGPTIEPIPVRTVFAEAGAVDDALVTLSLCDHVHLNDRIDNEGTWGYEVDLTPDEAENLAESLRIAADRARRAAVSS